MQYQHTKGQTLIETVVAIFILVMGMTAAVGLAIYAFAGSTSVTKQIIATGLAREGIEAVKNIRDTNWLFTSLSIDCYNYATSNNSGKCYKNWLRGDPGSSGVKKGFDIDPGVNPGCYRIKIQPDPSKDSWQYNKENCNSRKWGLDFQNSFSSGFEGIYTVTNLNTGPQHGTSSYYRKIILEKNTAAPYDENNMEQVMVTVQVWWVDKKCPRIDDWPGKGRCSLELKTNLTNWRDY